jgi:glycosyltransferase involved in cell wall biosynthesis
MRALVSASARFNMAEDGSLWTQNASLGYKFWSRYLDVYDEVNLLVRVQPHTKPLGVWKKVSGPGIQVIPIPNFTGPWEFVKRYISVKKVITNAVRDAEAIHLRIPCTIGTEVCNSLQFPRPYGVEVVADPYDIFAPGSVKHPLSPFFRFLSPLQLRQECTNASAALYVTKQALQRRYPCPNLSVGVSDVELPDDMELVAPRQFDLGKTPLKLIFVGTLAQLYKAPDVLIKAFAAVVSEGIDINLVMIGEGKHQAELEAQVQKLGIANRVHFLGQLASSEAVRAELDRADLFVLPSYQEGLPRAMVEAMARALPVIGSTVGGIPELLPPEDMVPPGDANALAHKIREVVTNPQRMSQMSARNLEIAKEYKEETLQASRIAFYKYVRELTQEWLKQQRQALYSQTHS